MQNYRLTVLVRIKKMFNKEKPFHSNEFSKFKWFHFKKSASSLPPNVVLANVSSLGLISFSFK